MDFFFNKKFKGGQRSAADKAKISEGVRARNRAILLEKLQKLGMTEEEWTKKKKEIKYLRERVRKARAAKNARLVAEQEKLLQSALADTEVSGKKNNGTNNNKIDKKTPKENVAANKAMQTKIKQPKAPIKQLEKGPQEKKPSQSTIRRRKKRKEMEEAKSAAAATAKPKAAALNIFARDVNWKHHGFDSSEKDCPYKHVCPNGGPGGLICCAFCSKHYSNFLTGTANDIEEQKTHKVNKEAKELLGLLSEARTKLDGVYRLAKSASSNHGWQRTAPLQRHQLQQKHDQQHQAIQAPIEHKNSQQQKKKGGQLEERPQINAGPRVELGGNCASCPPPLPATGWERGARDDVTEIAAV